MSRINRMDRLVCCGVNERLNLNLMDQGANEKIL